MLLPDPHAPGVIMFVDELNSSVDDTEFAAGVPVVPPANKPAVLDGEF